MIIVYFETYFVCDGETAQEIPASSHNGCFAGGVAAVSLEGHAYVPISGDSIGYSELIVAHLGQKRSS